MKKTLSIFILFIAFIAISQPAMAGTVSIATAQAAAVSFFKLNSKNTSAHTSFTATLQYTKAAADNTTDFYVFNIAPGKGFVMVSADDQVSPIIAYSFESNFNTPAKGSSVQCWMDHAGSHIHQAIQRKVPANIIINNQWNSWLQGAKPSSTKGAENGVAPLLTTNWAQEPYYNQLCPYNAADTMQTVTGCVATAMAQIMKFWNYPSQGTGSYGYADSPPYYFNNYGNQSADFGSTTYSWSGMPDTLSGPNLAVATLMYHCAVAVTMNFGDDNQGGSGAYVLASDVAAWKHTAQMAYTTYFNYNKNTLQGVHESDYNSADWLNLMESELSAGRPVQYVGTDPNEGSHTWVCDGYDANDLLHMNWGWGGFDNGYYSVSSLTGDGYNFSTREEALIGIEPMNDLSATATAAGAVICSGNSTTLTAQGAPANASYSWLPVTGLSCPTCATTTASPLTTTRYTLTIDSAGLSAMAYVSINVNDKMNVESTTITDATCFGVANGSAQIEISGGNPGYKYLWGNGSTSASITGIAAGNYGVTVTDAKACTVSASATIAQPDVLVASISAANNACSLTNALLNANATGGTPAYFFSWNGGQNTSAVSSSVAGDYTVVVSDAAGCSASASIAVAQPDAIGVNIVASNTACSLLYAIATANVTGNNQNLSFNWSNGYTTASITNLSAGNFSVTVTDALGCISRASQNFNQPDSMNVSIATYDATDTKVYGKAIANVTGGTPQYSYLWNTGDNAPEISGLTGGTYTVTITDNKGCKQTAATQISETTGIDNPKKNIAFEVYPNPAAASATITLTGNYENTTMEVKNLLGQTLITQVISTAQTQLDLAALANGIYLVSLTQGTTVSIKEIVIQK